MHLNILDIDLDFFLNNKHTNGSLTSLDRLEEENYRPWSYPMVKRFLEKKCCLVKTAKVPGKFFVRHGEVFHYLRQLQVENDFQLTFSIDHIDAHADLGLGDLSYKYIAEELLPKPVKDRAYLTSANKLEAMHEGNFLIFLVACRWVKEIHYVTKLKWINDLAWFNFRGFNTASGYIELKEFTKQQMKEIINGNGGGMREAAQKITPVSIEPAVKYNAISYKQFKCKTVYDLAFLTQSPSFTPASSDQLIPIIESFFNLRTHWTKSLHEQKFSKEKKILFSTKSK
jgi:hypothetical protein